MALVINNTESVFGTTPSFGHDAEPADGFDFARIDPTLAYPMALRGPATMEFWLYVNSASANGYSPIICTRGAVDVAEWGGLFLYMDGIDTTVDLIVDGTYIDSFDVAEDQFEFICIELVHVAGYASAPTLYVYLNGVRVITHVMASASARWGVDARGWYLFQTDATVVDGETIDRTAQFLIHDLRVTQFPEAYTRVPSGGGGAIPLARYEPDGSNEIPVPSADFPGATAVERTVLHTGNYASIVGGNPLTINATWTFADPQVFFGQSTSLLFWDDAGEDISELFGARAVPEWESSIDLGDNPDGVLLRFSWTGTDAVDIRTTGVYEFNAGAWTKYQRLNEPDTINTQGGLSYELVLADASKRYIRMTNASANTVVVPANADVAFPIGSMIKIRQAGAGLTSIDPDVGVTVNATSLDSAGQHSMLFLEKVAADEWDLWGDLA